MMQSRICSSMYDSFSPIQRNAGTMIGIDAAIIMVYCSMLVGGERVGFPIDANALERETYLVQIINHAVATVLPYISVIDEGWKD